MEKDHPSTARRILHFPLIKIVIGMLVCAGAITLGQIGMTWFVEKLNLAADFGNLVVGITLATLAVISYSLLFRYYEKRPITELSTKKLGRNLIVGAGIGLILQSLTVLTIYLLGGYTVISINPFLFIVPALTMAFTSAVTEEILIRGIVFRVLEEKLGSGLALFLSAILFGLLHLGNPNSSLVTALGLAVQAGLLLGAAYIWSRNLWFPIALHFAWNFTQSGIFGASTSGRAPEKTLITSAIKGADWFTGGDFGPEGSVQATLFCLMAAMVLLILARDQKKFVLPWWRTQNQ